MKLSMKSQYLPYLSLGAGLLGLLLRLWLFATGIDDRGLLIGTHPGAILSLVLTVPVAVLTVLGARTLEGNLRYRRLFPASVSAAVGTLVGALALARSAWQELGSTANPFAYAACTLGMAAALSLVFLAFLRWKGSHPSGWLYGIVCVYFMLHLVCQYRVWSGQAQLQNYLFPMLSSVMLMMGCYYRAALTAKLSSRMPYVLCNQLAVYLCLLAIPGSGNALFFAAMALWMGLDLCSLKNPRKASEPAQEG